MSNNTVTLATTVNQEERTIYLEMECTAGFLHDKSMTTDNELYDERAIARLVVNPDHDCAPINSYCNYNGKPHACDVAVMWVPAEPAHRQLYYQIIRSLILSGKSDAVSFTY